MTHEQLLEMLKEKGREFSNEVYQTYGSTLSSLTSLTDYIAEDVVNSLSSYSEEDISSMQEKLSGEYLKYLNKPRIREGIYELSREQTTKGIYEESDFRKKYIANVVITHMEKIMKNQLARAAKKTADVAADIASAPKLEADLEDNLTVRELPSPVSVSLSDASVRDVPSPVLIQEEIPEKLRKALKTYDREGIKRDYSRLPEILYKILPELSSAEKSELIAAGLSAMAERDIQRLNLDESFLKLVALSTDPILRELSLEYIRDSNDHATMGRGAEDGERICDRYVTRLEHWTDYMRAKDAIIMNVDTLPNLDAYIQSLAMIGFNKAEIKTELENLFVEVILSAEHKDVDTLKNILYVADFTDDKKSVLVERAIIEALSANKPTVLSKAIELLDDEKLKKNIMNIVMYGDSIATDKEKISQLSSQFEISRKKMHLRDFISRSKAVVDDVKKTLRENAEQMPTKIPKPKLRERVAETASPMSPPIPPEVRLQAKQVVAAKIQTKDRAAPVLAKNTRMASQRTGPKSNSKSKPIWH